MVPPRHVPSEFPDDVPLVDHVRALMWNFRIPAACLNVSLRKTQTRRGQYYRNAFCRLCYLLTMPSPNGHTYHSRDVVNFLDISLRQFRAGARRARTIHHSKIIVKDGPRTRFPLTTRIQLQNLPL